MNFLTILVCGLVFNGLAVFAIANYLMSRPRPPMFEGDGDDE